MAGMFGRKWEILSPNLTCQPNMLMGITPKICGYPYTVAQLRSALVPDEVSISAAQLVAIAKAAIAQHISQNFTAEQRYVAEYELSSIASDILRRIREQMAAQNHTKDPDLVVVTFEMRIAGANAVERACRAAGSCPGFDPTDVAEKAYLAMEACRPRA